MATKLKKTQVAGAGAGLQLLGVLAILSGFLMGSIGVVLGGGLGVGLLIYGSRRAKVHVCSDCRGEVDAAARVCRHCRAELWD